MWWPLLAMLIGVAGMIFLPPFGLKDILRAETLDIVTLLLLGMVIQRTYQLEEKLDRLEQNNRS